MTDEAPPRLLTLVSPPVEEKNEVLIKVKFSPTEEIFIENYLETLDVKKAAEACGFNEKASTRGWKMYNTPKVKLAINEMLRTKGARLDVTELSVTEKLERNYWGALEKGDFASANKAAELLGKHIGMFKDQLDINVHSSYADLVAGSMDIKGTEVEGEAHFLLEEGERDRAAESGKPVEVPDEEKPDAEDVMDALFEEVENGEGE